MDYDAWDEVDRANAFKSRKKTGKWCKGKRGVVCEYVTTQRADCQWNIFTPKWPRGNTEQRAYWKCNCVTKCKNCGRHPRRIRLGPRQCVSPVPRYVNRPTDPNIQISYYGW